jgi:hypothetical protein
MGSLDRWNRECGFVEGLVCAHQGKMYTSDWNCMRDCEKLDTLREITTSGISIEYGTVKIIKKALNANRLSSEAKKK